MILEKLRSDEDLYLELRDLCIKICNSVIITSEDRANLKTSFSKYLDVILSGEPIESNKNYYLDDIMISRKFREFFSVYHNKNEVLEFLKSVKN